MIDTFSENEKYLRDFFDNAPFGFHVFGPDQIIMDMNKTELDLLGYDYSDVVGKMTWTDLIADNQMPLFKNHWKTIQNKGTVKNFQYTLRRKDGTQVYVLLYASARFDTSGKLINTRGIVVDLTQSKEMEKALAYVRQQMKDQEVIFKEKNTALNDIMARLEIEKNRYAQNTKNNIENVILPLVTNLRRRGSALDQTKLDLLEASIRNLMSDFGTALTVCDNKLTAREMEICNMIKNDYSTKDIADNLNVSFRTVDNHRMNIRKKLNLGQRKLQLSAYLKSMG